ncbi:MAG: sulfur carrier protein ThiS [Nitrospiraceae bacterium]|nr:sulfur carrier protein ThiS [Nitrospiraceae bacterium]
MKIMLNGEDYETEASTLRQLLDELHVAVERVAVELNLTIVRRADHDSTYIKENDAVEIIHFVGGG